jgi:hypothetical protein
MSDRPATTEPESLPIAEDAAQDVWRLRRMIADEISAARINGVGPWTAADSIAKALDRAGYTVAPKVAFPHKGMTAEQVAEWRKAAARASEAPGDAQSPTPDVGAAQDSADGSAAKSEPPVYIVETLAGRWGPEFDNLADARIYAEYCRETYGQTRIVRVTREVIQ